MTSAEREDWRAKMAAQRKVDVETFGGVGEPLFASTVRPFSVTRSVLPAQPATAHVSLGACIRLRLCPKCVGGCAHIAPRA